MTLPSGRPKLITEVEKEIILAALILGHNISEAAAVAGLDHSTVYREMARDPEFKLQVRKIVKPYKHIRDIYKIAAARAS
jgi:hypothetical protein